MHRARAADRPDLVGGRVAGNPGELRSLQRRAKPDDRLARHHLAAIDDLAIEAWPALPFEAQRRQEAQADQGDKSTDSKLSTAHPALQKDNAPAVLRNGDRSRSYRGQNA